MSTYVLVHGAWTGAHIFRAVRRPLRQAGHEVLTPALTGIGERVHLTSPQVCLTTHVQDVANCVLYEDLDEIVLVGFSYGGMVVTGAVEHLASRIAELVYLDAFLPRDGEALYDLTGQSAAPPPAPPGPTAPPGQPWLVDPPPRTPPSDAAVAAWFAARRTAHPRRCFTEAVHLPRPLESYDFGLTYVKATGAPRPEGGDAFWRAADRVRSSPRWRYREIGSDHTVPTTRPAELAALLLELT